MKLQCSTIGCLLLCLVSPLRVSAAEGEGEDSQVHTIRIQVLLVDSGGGLDQDELKQLSGPSDGVFSALRKFADEGKAEIVNHAELTVLEQAKSMLQIGETVSMVSGTTRSGPGRESRSYQSVSLGTLINLTTKVEDDHILIDIDFSKSYVTPREEEDSERPDGTSQLTHQSTLRIKNGNAQMVARMMSRESGELGGVQLIVAAEILDSSVTSQTTRFRSFSQQSSRSSSVSNRPDSLSQRRAASGGPSEEARRRLGNAMFQRADSDKDGEISESELSRLTPRDPNADFPITKEKYVDWIATQWQPTRRSSNASSVDRLPGNIPPRARPQQNEDNEDAGDNEDNENEG